MSNKWTTTPPTEPGWYWTYYAKGPAGARTVRLLSVVEGRGVYAGAMCVETGDGYEGMDEPISVDAYTYWLGPLPVPEPPK